MNMRSNFAKLGLAAALLPILLNAAEERQLSIDQVRRMSSAQAATGVPLRVRGVVSALSGWSNSFFLQGQGGGVSVDRTDSADVRAGDLVEVTGKTGAGKFAPVLQVHSVTILARGTRLPEALKARYGDLAAGRLDSQRVEVRGVVHSATVTSSWGKQALFLGIDLNGELVTARVREFPVGNFDNLVDATVRVRGVAGTIFNEKRQFLGVRIFVPELADVSVEEKGAGDPFSIKESTFSEILQFDPSSKLNHRVHVAGVLIGERGGQTLYLQNGSEGIVVKTEQPVRAAVGTRVEASGFIRGGDYSPALYNAIVRTGGMAPLPSPARIPAAKVIEVKDGFAFAPTGGTLVQMEGDVIDRIDRRDEQVWVLRDQDKLFEAHLALSAGVAKISGIAGNSRVRVEGICLVEINDAREPESFRVLMRTARDIEVVRAPLFTTARLLWCAAAMILFSAGALIFSLRVRRRNTDTNPDTFVAEQRLQEYCQQAARVAGGVSASVCALVLVGGWMMDISRLRTVFNGYSAMRPLTALGLLFAGIAGYLNYTEKQAGWRKRVISVCGIVTLFIGLMPLIEAATASNFNLEQTLVRHGVIAPVQGRMAFLTALNFVMIGCGILMSRSRLTFSVGQYLAMIAGIFGLFNALGYLYGIKGFFGLRFDMGPVFGTAMAIHTAICMLILSAGLLLSRPSWGVMVTVTSKAPGGVITRRLLPCALVIPAIVGWLRMQGQAHGLYDGTFGLTLFAATNITIFMFVIWRSGTLLNRSDAERLNEERQRRESETDFKHLADAMPPIVWTAKPDGNVDYYNQRWYDYTGMTLQESRDWGWKPVLHPDDLENCLEHWTTSLRTGDLYEVEYRFKRARDGKFRWHLGRATPVRDEHGTVLRWFGSCTDIEDTKRAQTAIEQLNETLELRVQHRTAALAGANQELADTRVKLQGVLDSATQLAIIVTDTQGVIEVFNTGAERMLQYSAREVEGLSTPIIFHDAAEYQARSRQLTEELGRPVSGLEVFVGDARLGVATPREWTFIRKDGSTLEVSLTITGVRDSGDELIGFLGTATDITARKCLERNLLINNDKLAEQTRRAEEANRVKSDFLATMSHEIRTPMNAILGMADLLWESELNSEQLRYVEVFRRAGSSLLTLINEILDLSKIEAGHLELECIEFDLENEVRNVMELIEVKTRAKGLKLTSRLMPGLNSARVGDPTRLRQILINLLGNAVKFTDAGEVALHVHVPDVSDPGYVEFSVSDSGIGIPADKLATIFEDFTQVDPSMTRRFGGTGLGLGISKRLVEQMGGTIGVTSSAAGSTFAFSVRLEIASAGLHNQLKGWGEFQDRKILILDDSTANCRVLCESLASLGLQTVESQTLREALIHLAEEREPFSLVIVDECIEGSSGFEASRSIREGHPSLPVIMMTSHSLLRDADREKLAGIYGYAVKPVVRSELFRLVSRALRNSESVDTPGPVEPSPRRVSQQRPLEILIVEDSSDNRLLMDAYLRGTPHYLTFVENGREAVRAFEVSRFDIVLMDVQMPVMDGLTATRAIRLWESGKGLSPTPILSVSANARLEDVQQSHDAGCTAHLSKPISKSRLLSALEKYGVDRPDVEPEKIWVEVPEGLEELVPEYLASKREELARAVESLGSTDMEQLRILGHNLKGSGASYGFDEVSTLGAALQASAREGNHEASVMHVQSLAAYLDRVELRIATSV